MRSVSAFMLKNGHLQYIFLFVLLFYRQFCQLIFPAQHVPEIQEPQIGDGGEGDQCH